MTCAVDWDQPLTWAGVTREGRSRDTGFPYDEWCVASFYDQNRFGADDPGWWQYPNRPNEPFDARRAARRR